jgi:hypothetical protein
MAQTWKKTAVRMQSLESGSRVAANESSIEPYLSEINVTVQKRLISTLPDFQRLGKQHSSEEERGSPKMRSLSLRAQGIDLTPPLNTVS